MLKTLTQFIQQFNKIFLSIFVVNIIFFILVFALSAGNAFFSEQVIFILIIFIANNILAFYFYQKNIIIPYVFLIAAILAELFTIIYFFSTNL